MLLIVLMIRVIPIFVSLYLVMDRGESSFLKKASVKIITVLSNMIVFEIVHCILRGYPNFLATIYYIYTFNFTYEELVYFPVSFILCYVAAIYIGKICNRLFYKCEKRTNILFQFHSIVGLIVLVLCYVSFSGKSHIVINEICSNNENCYLGEEYSEAYGDYIEICNTGKFMYYIDQIWLSDDNDNLKKVSIENKKMAAGECLVIGLDNDSNSFSISNDGEWIYMSDNSGKVLDKIYSVSQETDVAYSRIGTEWKLMKCSPGYSNENAVSLIEVECPILSHNSGFFSEPFYLEILSNEDVDIYYSLDGSIPDENSVHYTDEIYVYDCSANENKWNSIQNVVEEWKGYTVDETPVPKAFIIRVVAIDADGNKSDIVTATYFVGKTYENQKVISLIADPNDLFGEDGIYLTGKAYDEWYLGGCIGDEPATNFSLKGRKSEISATMELFQDESILKQNVGLRIMGGSARTRPKKRFAITARKEYSGDKWFDCKLFGDYDTHSFAIREGVANVFSQYLVEDRDVIIQDSVPVVVYLNGEYWYTSYMQERYTEELLENKYGVDEENVLIAQEGIVNDSVPERNALDDEIYSFIDSHDLKQKVYYDQFCELIDIQSYIDYCCINLYLCNIDCDEEKNCIMWRTKECGEGEYEDNRWRWTIYDMDALEWNYKSYYGVDSTAEENNFLNKGPFVPSTITRSKMFMGLKANPEFRRQFVLSFMDIANTNFSENQVSEVLEDWGLDITWNDSFFLNRKKYAVKYLAEELGLEGTIQNLYISTSDSLGGEIIVNTIKPEFIDNKWNGEYFTDYPIMISVQPNEGYRFVGWTGCIESKEKEVSVFVAEGGSSIHAVFEKID